MKRFFFSVMILVGLIFVSVALVFRAISGARMNLITITVVTTISLCLLGMLVLVAVWLSMWMMAPRQSVSRSLHDQKMLRHQLSALQKEIAQKDRTISSLQAQVQQLKNDLFRQTTEFSAIRVNDASSPLPLPPVPMVTGKYATAKTGSRPIFKTGEMHRTTMSTRADNNEASV